MAVLDMPRESLYDAWESYVACAPAEFDASRAFLNGSIAPD